MTPVLIDCRGIQETWGVKRHVAEQVMRQIEKVTVPGVRRVYVRRADVARILGHPEDEQAA